MRSDPIGSMPQDTVPRRWSHRQLEPAGTKGGCHFSVQLIAGIMSPLISGIIWLIYGLWTTDPKWDAHPEMDGVVLLQMEGWRKTSGNHKEYIYISCQMENWTAFFFVKRTWWFFLFVLVEKYIQRMFSFIQGINQLLDIRGIFLGI
jgi:hypothetical protein